MFGWAHELSTGLSNSSRDFPGSSDAEPVIVTPCRTSSEFGCAAAVRDRVFATHCEFSWRSETVSAPSGDVRRTLVFKRHKQTGSFDRAALHDQVPRPGDRITRTFDGATFQIASIYTQAHRFLCDLVEVEPQLQ